jgi:dipeptidyl aminopeptidase/acylaminoacyl peptidase
MKSMKRQIAWISLLFYILAASPFAFAQSKDEMTIDYIMSLRVASDPRISPNTGFVAYVVTQADMKTNFRNSDVWVVPSHGFGQPRQLTNSPKRDDSPRWSPDSQRIAFISDRDGKAQLYVLSLYGGEPIKLTDVKTAVQSFEWSPDGKRIAYIAADPLPEVREKEKRDGFDQIVVDENYQFAHINIIEVLPYLETDNIEMLSQIKLDYRLRHAVELEWSPDGKFIAFTARETPKLADTLTTEIFVVDLSGNKPGSPYQVTLNDRSESNLAWSPDGKKISFLSTEEKYPSIGPLRIQWVMAPDTSITGARSIKRPDVILPQFEGYITKHDWSADGRFIYFTADLRTGRRIGRVSPDGKKLELQPGEGGLEGPFTLTSISDRIAYIKEDPTHPADVWTGSISPESTGGGFINNQKQLTRVNHHIDRLAFGRVEVIRWKSKDGREIEGVLVYPIDYQQGKRYPLITSLHGGPEGAYTLSFMASYGEFPHVYAGAGYASFFPNFRGSSNYGAEFASANVGDLGGGDYEDVMSGVDYLIGRGIADPARLAIKGYSYGGYLAGWIIGHTDRFKAAVFGAGLSNAISYYSTGDIQYQRETLHQGTPWSNNKNMIERSPVMYLQNAKTPSLIYHGEKDERVPLGQSLETYMGLKKAKVPTQLVIYPREGHGLREPKHQLDKMRRELKWIETNLRVNN